MEQMEQPGEACLSLYRGKFLELLKEGRWEYVRRVNASGAVMIVAVTKEGELLLVEEYRVPLHARTVGLPAGISGDEGEESTLQSARRELEEETGYRADSWTYLFAGPSSPGLTTEMVSFYLAEDLHRISAGGGVAHENITVHRIPLPQVHDWLMEQMGQGKWWTRNLYGPLFPVLLRQWHGTEGIIMSCAVNARMQETAWDTGCMKRLSEKCFIRNDFPGGEGGLP